MFMLFPRVDEAYPAVALQPLSERNLAALYFELREADEDVCDERTKSVLREMERRGMEDHDCARLLRELRQAAADREAFDYSALTIEALAGHYFIDIEHDAEMQLDATRAVIAEVEARGLSIVDLHEAWTRPTRGELEAAGQMRLF